MNHQLVSGNGPPIQRYPLYCEITVFANSETFISSQIFTSFYSPIPLFIVREIQSNYASLSLKKSNQLRLLADVHRYKRFWMNWLEAKQIKKLVESLKVDQHFLLHLNYLPELLMIQKQSESLRIYTITTKITRLVFEAPVPSK